MRVVIVTGGEHDGPLGLDGGDPGLVIAADSGVVLARRAGLRVDVVVGDMDSAPPEVLAEAVSGGARVERHPTAKDKTDLALALDLAMAEGAEEVLVLGGAGGRLDHLMANVALLAADEYRTMAVRAQMGTAMVTVVRSAATLRGSSGSLLTLLAVGGPAAQIRTTGLAYPLDGDTLEPGSSRGVSNVMLDTEATVSVGSGVLVAIQPGPA